MLYALCSSDSNSKPCADNSAFSILPSACLLDTSPGTVQYTSTDKSCKEGSLKTNPIKSHVCEQVHDRLVLVEVAYSLKLLYELKVKGKLSSTSICANFLLQKNEGKILDSEAFSRPQSRYPPRKPCF